MKKKFIIFIMILITLLLSIIPTPSSNKISTSKIIYVDDDGGADYTKIQDAIDNASEGDTIYVYGGMYKENIELNKKLSLIGENKNTTIIDGKQEGCTINLSSENTIIKNFTIIGGGYDTDEFTNFFRAGIRITGSNNTIYNNIFRKNCLGISGVRVTNLTIKDNNFIEDGIGFTSYENDGRPEMKIKYFLHNIDNNTVNGKSLYYISNEKDMVIDNCEIGQLILVNCSNLRIKNVSISKTDWGLVFAFCNNCSIEYCSFFNNSLAIWTLESNNNLFQFNNISNNYHRGVVIDYNSNYNQIKYNIIHKTFCGVEIEWWSNSNLITENNFLNNNVSGYEHQSLFSRWNKNYYDDWIGLEKQFLFFYPKIIYGMPIEKFPGLVMPVSYDFHPAKEPYKLNPAIEVGPYTQNVTDESITIVWETNIPTMQNYVLFDETTDYQYKIYSESNCSHHEVTIKPGFSSGYYKVFSDNLQSKDYNFHLSDKCLDTGEFRCILMGDSRGMWDDWEHASLVAYAANKESPDIVIHGGDMVDDGSVDDQWMIWLDLMMPLMQNSTVYGVIGNHERNASRYYEIFSLPNNEMWYSFDYGPCHFIILDNYVDWDENSVQYSWLEADLSMTNQPFIIVCFHEPIYCSGGHSPRIDVREVWEPLFNEYHIDLVVQSHCHYYQRTIPINDTIYIVSGGAGAPLYSPSDDWFIELSKKAYHYCILDVSLDPLEMICTVKDIDGVIIDEFLI